MSGGIYTKLLNSSSLKCEIQDDFYFYFTYLFNQVVYNEHTLF